MQQNRSIQLAHRVADRWDATKLASLAPLPALAYRSNALGQDRSVANFGGGNTSTKTTEHDHTGREIEVLYVKGSGSDLATIAVDGFTGFRQAEVLALFGRERMTDQAMVAYLARCQVAPDMPRGSIETLLHAFVPAPCVDHTHPDAINMIACAEDGEKLARACFGDDAIWIPYVRPGFLLAKQVGEAVRACPLAKLVILAKHGLVTWGDDPERCYRSTLDAINRAVDFVNDSVRNHLSLEQAGPPISDDAPADVLAHVLPVLRGAVSEQTAKILVMDTSDDVMSFVRGAGQAVLSQIGAACPDHLVHTKMRPLWIDFDRARDDVDQLRQRIEDRVARYREQYASYVREQSAAHNPPDGGDPIALNIADPNPRVVLIQGVGLVGIGRSHRAACLSRDLYHRAIAVMRGAAALGGFVSLTESESYAVEYWPLERYKLTLAPPPKELAGKVAFITGGAGGIGRAVGNALAAEGACVVAADLNGPGAEQAVQDFEMGLGIEMDVTNEAEVIAAFRRVVLAYGGVDIVVSNAGLASSAPIEETSVDLWDRNHDVLAKGYFLVAREAFRVLKAQGIGGSLIFVASKNAIVASKSTSAYSSAKAAEVHLARCLSEEGGAAGIRVNVVNPDAVLQGSQIWHSSWRAERAAAYGITPEELEAYYRARTILKVNILPEDIAEAVRFFASPRAAKSTGNMLNVDGGVVAAYPR